MWIVSFALRRPYTIGVLAFLILIMGILSISHMMVDIFPVIDIPVVSVVWNYPGLSAEEMERRVVLLDERGISSTVNGVSRIESESIPGIGLMKVYFEKGADIGAAIAQISSVSATATHSMPPGIQPPVVIQYNASNVPVAQLTLSSKTMTEAKIYDYALNFIRVRLFTIPGLATPAPFGGANRQIMIDIDPRELAARGLSPQDILNALQASNVIIPAGTARMGQSDYNVQMNSSPTTVDDFNNIPVRVVNGETVTIGDVAKVSDSYAEQTNIVRVNRSRATYLSILKKANASTLAVVEAAKEALPSIEQVAPKGLVAKVDFDQSVFVRNSIDSVLHEGVEAAALVSLMILIFLGSWRSVLIVCTSIPLSILVSLIGLNISGNTLNIMTLGGLSLAIGMLVDDATVTVENIHRNRMLGKKLTVAIVDGTVQIATPALLATLSICIVFFPVVLLTGPSRFLFTPMALAVVLAMLASYVLSRTLVPVLSRILMEHEHLHGEKTSAAKEAKRPGFFSRAARNFNEARDKGFDKFRESYGRFLHALLLNRIFTLAGAGIILLISLCLLFYIGTDFFPTTDTGLMKLHFRAPSGTRLEQTEKLTDQAEARIQHIIPTSDLETINDMIGVPTFYNLGFVSTDNASEMDAEILISLKPGHKPTRHYMDLIRKDLNDHFPGCTEYFQSADIVSQVLNFGLSSPIDIQVQYPDYNVAYRYARKLQDSVSLIPGLEDINIKQVLDYPTLQVNVDRIKAAQLGITQRDVANSLLISLSSSSTISPSFYLNPTNNVNYQVAVEEPFQKINSVQSLMNTPVTPAIPSDSSSTSPQQLPMAQVQDLGNLASISTQTRFNMISHYTVQRVIDIDANVEGRDLGFVTRNIQNQIDKLGHLPAGMVVVLKGQGETMHDSFHTLGLGMILAIALVYLLMVVLFQSWLDPFIIMVAVPGAFIGILWMLAITGTTINVVSLMGSIVAVGIAVSNSILLVSFANDVRIEKNIGSLEGALEAGKTRLRPVLMTAIAMILGMIPMSIGAGAGGEQNAPLGRAVIGGLMVATLVTLFIVPVVYSVLRKDPPELHLLDERFREETEGDPYQEHKPGQQGNKHV